MFFFVSSQSTRVTDRQTDGQNYDPQDRASIVASRGKNEWIKIVHLYVERLYCIAD